MSIEVILVDREDNQLGSMEKMKAHQLGILHRAFSVFIFNGKGEMLLQQRADGKYHNGGVWSNACCSHPKPGEETLAAAERRLVEEMGFTTAIHKAFDFIYTAEFDNGLTENEFDHVYTGIYNGPISPDPAEVKDYAFISISKLESELFHNPQKFTIWFKVALREFKIRNNTGVSL